MIHAFQSLAEVLALRAVQSLAEGSLVVLLSASVLRIARQSAGTRFAVWFSSLIAIALLPIINGPLWGKGASATEHAAITLPGSWATYIFILWLAVAGGFLFGVARAILHLRNLRQSCTPIDASSIDPFLQATLQRHGRSRDVVLCTSGTVRVPTAIGLFKPAILIPNWVMQELSVAEINQILVHELAHLRRWDDWTNLVQQIVKALFFFHPLVWWIEKKASLEREMACDDAVLAEAATPHAYAECLAHLAEKSFLHRSIVLAQAALGRVRQTSMRIAQILDPNRPSSQSRIWKPAISLVAVFAVASAVSIAHGPRLIAFGHDTPSQADQTVATLPLAASHHVTLEPEAASQYEAVADSSQKIAITPARLILRPVPAKLLAPQRSTAKSSANSKARNLTRNAPMIRLTSLTIAPAPATETLFVVIESRAPDSLDYQIQMWHVTVLRTPVNAVTPQVSHKEI